VPFTDDFEHALEQADHVVDAIFGACPTHPPPHPHPDLTRAKYSGFSFSGSTIREPFGTSIAALVRSHKPVLSVDAPSGWQVESGPPAEGPAAGFRPVALVSLTAPKPLVAWFKGRHFVGGR
jgi:NAD(P)H-hydrate epimerase